MLRFSIREILFATVAIAAVTALLVRNWPSEPTGLPNLLLQKPIAERAAEELGLNFKYIGGSIGKVEGNDTIRVKSTATILSPNFNDSGRLMSQMRSVIRKEILKADCVISGGGYSGNGKDDIQEFSFTYERAKTRGEVFISANRPELDAIFNGDKYWEIWMLAYEYSK